MIATTTARSRSLGLSPTRKAKDTAFTAFIWFCGVIALIPLAIIAVYVVSRGWQALSVNFFTKEPAGPLDPNAGGIVQSFIGTGIIVGIAALISIPLGLLTAVYLSEYGSGKLATIVRFVAETLLSTPSIVAGAFIWAVFVVATGHFSAIAGALSISVLMWPIIVRATEEVLRTSKTSGRARSPLECHGGRSSCGS